jgi:23S rRNA (cytidine1920-2'-O)/16S rRNA (cytidine1409-2'-O)-methyltransferase
MRIDVLLVEKGLAPSRNRAQDLIASGRVFLVEGTRRTPIKKASQKIEPRQRENIEVEADAATSQFVSRGGIKMKGALERVRLDVRGFRALDVGISTGGFTDCLLQAGASGVVGVDVGHGQLAPSLQADPRVRLFEGINARNLAEVPLVEANAGRKFDLVVVDVSFISLTLVLPEVVHYLKESASVLALVKPQFEVGRDGLGKNGIVKNAALYQDVEAKIRRTCQACGLSVEDYFESPIEGSDGNREFFVYARHPQLGFSALDSRGM